MTGSALFAYVLPLLVIALVAAAFGGLTAWWLLRRRSPADSPDTSTAEFSNTEFVDAEIDLAAVAWAEANNLPPEAAGLMAARLKNLTEIGRSRGWL